jgi:hypothetical protein
VQVLAVLREITWLETQYHEGMEVKDGWLTRLIVWSLSTTAKFNRQQLLAANAEQRSEQDDDQGSDVEEEVVSVYIGSHNLQPTIELSSNTVSLAAEGSSTDVLASPVPVLESPAGCAASQRRLGGMEGFDPTNGVCCAHSCGACTGDGRSNSLIGSPSAEERHSAGRGVVREGIVRLGAGRHRACDVPQTDSKANGDMGAHAAELVVSFRGDAEISMSDILLTKSSRTMCVAESGVSSLHLADSGLNVAGLSAEATEASAEVCGEGALGCCDSDDARR